MPRDELLDPMDGPKIAHAIAGSKLVLYQNVGHVPMEKSRRSPQQT